MDKMQVWELNEYYDVLNYADYATWEQTRYYLACHVDHKKVKNITDIMKFPWDNINTGDKEISNEQIHKLKTKAAAYLKNINKTNNGSTT